MLYNKIYDKFCAKTTIVVEGFFIEKFINICANKKIKLNNVKSYNSCMFEAEVNAKNIKDIKNISKKTKTKFKIIDKKGLPFILHRYRKRKYIILLVLLISLLLIYCNSLIWKIDINVDDDIIQSKVELELEKMGIQKYSNKYNFDKKYVKNDIMINIPQISWIELSLKGVVLSVDVKIGNTPPEVVDDFQYCNIVAKKRGVVDKVVVKYGNAKVQQGDIVEEGDVLISGYVESELVDDWYLHAKGDVNAKVWYSGKIFVPLNEIKIEYTGNEKLYYGINFQKYKIFLGKLSTNYEEYDTILKKKNIEIFKTALPIYFFEYKYVEKNTNVIERTYEEAVKYGENILIKYLNIQIPDDARISETYTNTDVVNNGVNVEVIYECIEQIGIEQNIY